MAPILEERFHIVQGSRMIAGGAREGGMPLTRYLPNRVLTAMENIVFGTKMAEFHSGYMLYSKTLLEQVPFDQLQNNYKWTRPAPSWAGNPNTISIRFSSTR